MASSIPWQVAAKGVWGNKGFFKILLSSVNGAISNTGSANVSGYKISSGGALTLLDANGITGTTGFSPIDMSLSKNSKFLYTLNTVGRSISMFSVNNNGGLTSLGEITGLPEKTVGMAAE